MILLYKAIINLKHSEGEEWHQKITMKKKRYIIISELTFPTRDVGMKFTMAFPRTKLINKKKEISPKYGTTAMLSEQHSFQIKQHSARAKTEKVGESVL